MPQARLPDINTAFNYHRGKAITHWASANYIGAIGSLYAFNNCLPKNYQIKISTKEYNDKVNHDVEAYCSGCQQPTKKTNMKKYQLLNSGLVTTISNSKFTEVWTCDYCSQDNKLSQTKFIQKVLAKPYCIRLVPEPPEAGEGLLATINFKKKFDVWFWQMLDEEEFAAAKFRDDNWQKADAMGNVDSDINTDGEDEA